MAASRRDGRSDAIVFFGATGDLAFNQIFPALAGLVRDEGMDLPIVGVARSGDLTSLRERARDDEPGTWGPPYAASVLRRGDRWHGPAAIARSSRRAAR